MIDPRNRFWSIVRSLQGEIGEQPESPGHTEGIQQVIDDWLIGNDSIESVLDVGCGRGESLSYLALHEKQAHGVVIGQDYAWVQHHRGELVVFPQDMHFLTLPEASYDAILCRHALEHSWAPLVVLKQFHAITRKYLIVVVPPLTNGVVGDNHYTILSGAMWERLFQLAGFTILETKPSVEPVVEHRYLLEKQPS